MNAAVIDQDRSISAVLNYHLDDGTVPVNETFGPANIHGRSIGTPDRQLMRIRDARPLAGQIGLDILDTLERMGFCLVQHHTALANVADKEELQRLYYPEMERLVCRVSGAQRAFVFDHTIRHGDQAVREEQLLREPVFYVHNDYTEDSAPRRVRELLPDEAEALLQKRFAIIQVWRPLRTISRNPLAMADARSISPADLVRAERRYPHRVGETYRLRHNPVHAWYYFSQMTPEEAIVFKVYDSLKDGRARFTPHTSFDDPATPADAPPRQSIEVRLFAFFD